MRSEDVKLGEVIIEMAEGEHVDYASGSSECAKCDTPDMGVFRVISADKVVMFYGKDKLTLSMRGFVKMVEVVSIIRSRGIEIEGPQTTEDEILLAVAKELGHEIEKEMENMFGNFKSAGDC
jgi:hypothetical protein